MQSFSLIDKHSKKAFDYKGPDKWAELTKAQFMLVMNAKATLSDSFKQAILLVQLLFAVKLQSIKKLTTVQAIQLAGIVNFLFEGDQEMGAWHVPKILRRMKEPLYGPGNKLANITFAEFMFADICVENYLKTKDEKFLNQLIGVLFREGNEKQKFETGDIRFEFNKAKIDAVVLEAEKFSQAIKNAVLINYLGCKKALIKPLKNVFPDRKEQQDEKPGQSQSWLDVAIQLARKEHALGSLYEIEKSNAFLVLKVLDKVIAESVEMQEELNSLKS